MGYHNTLKQGALLLAAAAALSVFSAQAATSIASKNTEFTPGNATQTLQAKAESWYNPTMGHTGWAHHSSWGWMKLKKGKTVTLTLETGVSGFHPALTVWYRHRKRGSAPIDQVNDHFYSQFDDIYDPNAINEDDKNQSVRVGSIQMEFVANAFDRDGMDGINVGGAMIEMLPVQFDQSKINRVVDGAAGKVSLTFTPQYNGVYQFVVGGINPDESLRTALLADGVTKAIDAKHNVKVTVGFPQ